MSWCSTPGRWKRRAPASPSGAPSRSIGSGASQSAGRSVAPAGTATFIKELRGPEFQNIYGSPVYGLAGAANTAEEFKEGKGVLAIHPVELAALGKPATAGCIGVDPALLTRFTVELSLPLGTPVDIVE